MERTYALVAAAVALPLAVWLTQARAQEKPGSEKKREVCSCAEASREERLERRKLEVARALATRLPGNPFTDVKVGDYWLYSMRRLAGDKPVQRGTLLWKVAEQEGDDVRVTEDVSGEATPWLGKSRWFNRQDPPTLANVFPRSGASHGRLVLVSDLALCDEKHVAGGETFLTRRLSWMASYEPDEPGSTGDLVCYTGSLWHTSDARSSIVGLQLKYLAMDDSKVTVELVGYGSEGKADWGKAPDSK